MKTEAEYYFVSEDSQEWDYVGADNRDDAVVEGAEIYGSQSFYIRKMVVQATEEIEFIDSEYKK